MSRRMLSLAMAVTAAMGIGSAGAHASVASPDRPSAVASNPVYDYVRHYLDWTDPFSRGLATTVVSTQPAAGPEGAQRFGIASYADGFMEESSNNPNKVDGTLYQYFNDRLSSASNPFDPARRDLLGVHIAADPVSQSVAVTLVALSWGGGSQNLTNLRIEDGVLVGDGASVGSQAPRAIFAITLGTVTIPG